MKLNAFARYAWGVLIYNLAVILWGAYVRATGSGAGCGSHWPLCNGEVVPRAPQLETIIEFTHRATSGIALLLVVGLLIWAFKAYPQAHIVRRGAVLSLIFIITEALVGAGLVLFEWVAGNESVARAFSMAIHLVNTLLLLAALTLTAWWASGGRPLRLSGQGLPGRVLALAFAGVLLVAVTGALIALGDTLLPTKAPGEELSPLLAALKRLRPVHPLIAMVVGLYLLFAAGYLSAQRPGVASRRLARTLTALFFVQLGAGALNVALMVPVWMQLVHLFLADLVWIALVLLAAVVLAENTTALETPEPTLALARASEGQ
ncbi:MAG: hypothetical protein KatS3mg057_0383 [Herpetosiphonaceae bacterium]|nr:MAG: hypothetical protein KatS3mg057_0383 [Herpetosiphonaceae bacterium]